MSKKALLVIDYTNDFVAEEGSLTCGKPGQDIEETIYNKVKEFIDNGDEVFFMSDCHERGDATHPEYDLFPYHNVRGTEGQKLYGKVGEIYEENKDNPFVHYREKTRYNAFAGTDLEMMLRQRGVEEVYHTGVCTHICSLHTVNGSMEAGFKNVVIEDGVASFDQDSHKWALDHMKNVLGARIE